MRVAALDLGSNTFLCLIADIVDGRVHKVIHDEVRVVRLGQNLFETRKFHPEALKRADECLKAYGEIIKKHSVEKVFAVATSAARDAENKEKLFEIGNRYKIPIQIIDGKMEAQVTYAGATIDCSPSERVVVVDVGGGSTEFVGKNKQGEVVKHSFNLGCVRLTEKYVTQNPIPQNEKKNLTDFIEKSILEKSELMGQMKHAKIIAVAGTPTTLADMILGGGFDESKIDGHFISKKDLSKWTEKLSNMSVEERLKIKGMAKGREDVMIAGLIILEKAIEVLEVDGIYVSTKGVRFGVAIEGCRGGI